MDQGVIRRKLAGVQQVAPDAGGGAEKAWPLALARAARDLFGLSFETGRVAAQRLSLTEFLDLPPDRAMIALLEGPRDGLGVLILSPDVLAGLIEAQTMGKVSSRPVVARKPTRTDAALVAGFLDAALAGLEAALVTDEDLVWTDGFRYASHLEDVRPLGLLLDDAALKVLQIDCVLGGVRTGQMILALPADGHGRRPHRSGAPVSEPAADRVFTAALGEQVMVSDATLQAVLARISLPLSAVMRLAVGDVLPLGMAALDRIDLDGIDGRRLGAGKLGQHRGMRAVRLAGDMVPEVRPEMAAPLPMMMAEEEMDYPMTGTG